MRKLPSIRMFIKSKSVRINWRVTCRNYYCFSMAFGNKQVLPHRTQQWDNILITTNFRETIYNLFVVFTFLSYINSKTCYTKTYVRENVSKFWKILWVLQNMFRWIYTCVCVVHYVVTDPARSAIHMNVEFLEK